MTCREVHFAIASEQAKNVRSVAVARAARTVCLLVMALAVCITGCTGIQDLDPQFVPVQFNFHDYLFKPNIGGGGSEVEFSKDGNYVCVWRWAFGAYYRRCVTAAVVVDLHGRLVAQAGPDGTLTEEFATLFPRVSQLSLYPDFTKDTTYWVFSDDLKSGFRLLTDRKKPSFSEVWTAELWILKPERKMVWSIILPETYYHPQPVGFLTEQNGGDVVMVHHMDKVTILSRKDGGAKETFTLGHIETEGEAKAICGKENPSGDEIRDVTFNSFVHALCPDRNLIACGAYIGKRVRVLSASSPHNVVFEAHSHDNPRRFLMNCWTSDSVGFAANRYLITVTRFSNRLFTPTENIDIYDVETWSRVWHEEGDGLGSVCVDPSGKRMARARSGVLEIGGFRVRAPDSQ
jgi:hypothetical protein